MTDWKPIEGAPPDIWVEGKDKRGRVAATRCFRTRQAPDGGWLTLAGEPWAPDRWKPLGATTSRTADPD